MRMTTALFRGRTDGRAWRGGFQLLGRSHSMTRSHRFMSAAAALALGFLSAVPAVPASKRELAASRYKSGAQLYEDLARVPRPELGLRQYELVISALDAVHRTDPSSAYCDDALVKIAELYQRMAEQFRNDKYRLKAIETYRFAAREYPQSKHRQNALAIAARLDGGPAAAPDTRQSSAEVCAPAISGPLEGVALSDGSHAAGEIIRPPGTRPGSGMAGISQIRHHSYDDGTRIVLHIESRTALKYDRLQGPERLYIDLFDSRMSAALIKGVQVDVADSLISSARLAQNRRNKARLVLDLKNPVAFDVFWLDSPTRFVLDLRGAGTSRAQRTLQALNPALAEPAANSRTAPRAADATADGKLSLTRALGLKPGRIVIDAGHGGHDTGSVGARGLREKDVVLDIAKRLGTLLETRLGADVIQTRDSDEFVELEERTRIANARGADLMISIHCNSAPTSSVRGIETYYLSLTSDSWALSVASQENATSNRTIHELHDLLAKITLEAKTEESKELATSIQSSLHKGVSKHSSRIRNRGIRKAPFVVLIGAEVPAVLAEIGFISNRHDEGLMRKSSFRQEVAEHLFDGIADYTRGLGTASMRTSLSPGSALRD